MLAEIHLSKNTYCSFLRPEHQNYDVIVNNIDAISSSIATAKKNRADRVLKETGESIDPDTINDTDLVFRVMTWAHIPLAPPKAPKPAKVSKVQQFLEETSLEDDVAEDIPEDLLMTPADPTHIRVNFPPFQHYQLSSNNEIICVGKSHWSGSLDTGSFCKTHGYMTETLALMFLKLCERYSTKGNWRYYTYLEEMRGAALVQLCQVGLQFDESKSNNPFGYFTTILKNAFVRILNLEKRNQDIRDDIMEANGLTPSFSRQMTWLKDNVDPSV